MDIYFVSSSTHVHPKIEEYQRKGGIETDSGGPSQLQKPFWAFCVCKKYFILLDFARVQKSRFKQFLIYKRIINHDQVRFIAGMQNFSISTSYSVWYTTLTVEDWIPYDHQYMQKRFWQNSSAIYAKNPSESQHRWTLPQHN